MTVHSFNDRLEFSQNQRLNPVWEAIYRKAFPTYKSMESIDEDGWAQRGGIDRLVILKSGKVIKVDEKIREKVWPDILLEYWSAEGKTPGWIAKDLDCDYIAYAFLPNQTCYLLPFQQLRVAWKKYRKDWVNQYKKIEALNRNYTTVSVAIPINILLQAIKESMTIKWDN